MKNLFNFLIVTLMLLSFSLTSNSQETYTFGCNGDEPFDTLDFTTEEGQTSVDEMGCKVNLILWDNLTIPYEPPYEGQPINVKLKLPADSKFWQFNVSFYSDDNGVSTKVDDFNFNISTGIGTIQLNDYVKNPKIVFEDNTTSETYILVESVTFEGENELNITNETLDETFKVYNYNNTLTVETNEFEDYSVEVYNLSGQRVFSEITNGDYETTLSDKGFYIVKLRYENQVLTKKVFIH
ncbi:MAG: T9SS type A sorting domain-containing protein [Brumimicrobium sp.]